MTKSVLLDITTICQSFPDIPHPEIQRDHILDSIESIFARDTDVVVVEGEGLGRTNILSQFARRYTHRTIAFFVDPTIRWAYDPTTVRFDIANQLEWLLRGREIPSTEAIDDGFVRQRLQELHRKARRSGTSYYFVADGLYNIPHGDASSQQVILDMLPLGLSGFKFLISGDTHVMANDIKKLRFKSYTLPYFTPNETAQYFASHGLASSDLKEIHDTCRGIPIHLASVRRSVQSGVAVETLLTHLPQQLPHLFNIEWDHVAYDNPVQLDVLAILAHERRRFTIAQLARILRTSEDQLHTVVNTLNFVIINQETQEIQFVSEAFRRFAAEKVQDKRRHVATLLIDSLIENPTSEEALAYLPGYLAQAERFDEFFTYLSPDTFSTMLERSESLALIQQKAGLGVETALRLGRDPDLIRLCVQKSALEELDEAKVWYSEVMARMSLKDYPAALTLAQNIVLREERLHLLAVIAKAQYKQHTPLSAELLEQIRQLYSQIDPTTLGERAIAIASDLLYSHRDLAIELIEKANTNESGEHALDWAFAQLSLTAAEDNENGPGADVEEDLNTRIKNPVVRRFTMECILLDDVSLWLINCGHGVTTLWPASACTMCRCTSLQVYERRSPRLQDFLTCQASRSKTWLNLTR